jgi:hypothetical protein
VLLEHECVRPVGLFLCTDVHSPYTTSLLVFWVVTPCGLSVDSYDLEHTDITNPETSVSGI